MEQLTHVFVLLAALSSVGTAQDLLYFTDGNERTFEVRPPVTEKITSIVWKINGDLLAEWSEKFPLEIYPGFKTRTILDTNNGRLVIRQMTKEDEGTYTVEINHKVQSGKYDMKWKPKGNEAMKTALIVLAVVALSIIGVLLVQRKRKKFPFNNKFTDVNPAYDDEDHEDT